ncbi:MAG: hypothetical protein V9G63_15540 [Candidatus Competibacter sp.]
MALQQKICHKRFDKLLFVKQNVVFCRKTTLDSMFFLIFLLIYAACGGHFPSPQPAAHPPLVVFGRTAFVRPFFSPGAWRA